jgi:ATP-dependent RNA helicase RhlE
MPDDGRGDRQQQQRGPRNPRRDGVKLEGGGQPHRVRKGRAAEARPTPERAFDPMARDRGRQTNNDPRHTSAPSSNEPKPVGEMKRRPRRRKPSNGGKGYAANG